VGRGGGSTGEQQRPTTLHITRSFSRESRASTPADAAPRAPPDGHGEPQQQPCHPGAANRGVVRLEMAAAAARRAPAAAARAAVAPAARAARAAGRGAILGSRKSPFTFTSPARLTESSGRGRSGCEPVDRLRGGLMSSPGHTPRRKLMEGIYEVSRNIFDALSPSS
jgi:hypothetical protein